jgi:hypothetical protein
MLCYAMQIPYHTIPYQISSVYPTPPPQSPFFLPFLSQPNPGDPSPGERGWWGAQNSNYYSSLKLSQTAMVHASSSPSSNSQSRSQWRRKPASQSRNPRSISAVHVSRTLSTILTMLFVVLSRISGIGVLVTSARGLVKDDEDEDGEWCWW